MSVVSDNADSDVWLKSYMASMKWGAQDVGERHEGPGEHQVADQKSHRASYPFSQNLAVTKLFKKDARQTDGKALKPGDDVEEQEGIQQSLPTSDPSSWDDII